jgi:glycosyltransferase involved in cell wall biosynthesis
MSRMSIDKGSKFTVIIPTRERADTLQYCLKTVTAQDYDNLEILVSDNFSCDGTEDVVRSFKDPRIVYKNTGKRVSMSHNWEFALSHINSGLVTILGDDDGLLPGALSKVSNIFKKTGALALRSSVCNYSWPSVNQYEYGRVGIPAGSGFEVRDTKIWLSKVLKGYANYSNLPMLYNGGFICSSLIKRIKNRNGLYYKSFCPDVYSAIAFSSIIENYIYSNEPFAINGASKHSSGISGFFGNKDLKDSPANKFLSEDNITLHPDIPYCSDGNLPMSLQALVYESYLQSKNLRDQAQEDIHQQQLEVILAKSGRHEASIREWGKIFATTHGLDYDKIQSKTNRTKIIINLVSLLGRMSLAINKFHVGSAECPINDVYVASIAAAAIRNFKPSRFKNFPLSVGRAVDRIIKIRG